MLQGNPPLSLELYKWLGALAAGAIAGFLTHWFSRRRQRTDVALKVVDSFMAMYSEIGAAMGILHQQHANLDASQENTVRKAGDWFELVAALYESNVVDRHFLEQVGLPDQMKRFRDLARSAQAQKPTFLADALGDWNHLAALR